MLRNAQVCIESNQNYYGSTVQQQHLTIGTSYKAGTVSRERETRTIGSEYYCRTLVRARIVVSEGQSVDLKN